jgi:type I restriction enzyme S subunit
MKPGYKQTEVGVIPEDWEVKTLAAIADKIMVGIASAATHAYRLKGVPMFRNQNIKVGFLDDSDLLFVAPEYEVVFKNKRLREGDLLTMRTGYPGVTAIVPARYDSAQSFTTLITRPRQQEAESAYLCHFINSECGQRFFTQSQIGGAQKNVNVGTLRKMPILLPKPTEQRAIATALSDVDGLLGGLDRLIAKKRDLKQAAMQQLLTGQTRLPGFHAEWEVKRLGEITDSLDNLRVPMNEAQRSTMKGDYPYCGANGVLGFVDNYVVDDDIILMAEDGGYFDEYETRPIAYRMTGKCWVNNHAHILKAKPGSDQGFLFYSLVHKNILPFLASGTRAKLNKSEMNKIEVRRSKDLAEQTAIAEVLTEMDAELAALTQRRDKTRALKQAMMQELLTGRIRLI